MVVDNITLVIPHGELGWLRALPHKGGGPGFEPPGGTGDLPGCSTPGPRGISRGARKLVRTSTVIKKKKKKKKKKNITLVNCFNT